MFLAIAAHCADGDTSRGINVSSVRDCWSKSVLGKAYNPVFYDRAQQADWVDPIKQGVFVINDDGIQHLSYLVGSGIQNASTSTRASLYIFEKNSTHSFDKFLRGIFDKAKSQVLIVDSWVDENIFDNVIDSVPKTLEINLLYGQKRGTFDSRVVRFKNEYQKFTAKRYSDLHDRFLVVDGTGYVLGPSIKDAASNSPALVVVLDIKDTATLTKFFKSLWKEAK